MTARLKGWRLSLRFPRSSERLGKVGGDRLRLGIIVREEVDMEFIGPTRKVTGRAQIPKDAEASGRERGPERSRPLHRDEHGAGQRRAGAGRVNRVDITPAGRSIPVAEARLSGGI
jgi:hypothetical protein